MNNNSPRQKDSPKMESSHSNPESDKDNSANLPTVLEEQYASCKRNTIAGPSSRPTLSQVEERPQRVSSTAIQTGTPVAEASDVNKSEPTTLDFEVKNLNEEKMDCPKPSDDVIDLDECTEPPESDMSIVHNEVRSSMFRLVHPKVAKIVSEGMLKSRLEMSISNLTSVLGDISREDAITILRASQWNTDTAVMAYFGEKQRARTICGRWRRLSGNATCLACLEVRNADEVLMHTTDCGVAMCAACWKHYFHLELTKGLRNTLRCPLLNCVTVVPDWLIEACCNVEPSKDSSAEDDEMRKAHIVAYRAEIMSDFVASTNDLFYCSHPMCDNVLSLKLQPKGLNQTITSGCGHRLCFGCKFEPHFPATCTTARLVQTINSKEEVQQIARNFKNVHRCGNQACGALLSNEGGCDNVRCRMCNQPQKWSELENVMDSIKKSDTVNVTNQQVRSVCKELALARDWNTMLKWAPDYNDVGRNFIYCVELVTWAKLKAIIEGPENWNKELIDNVSNLLASFGREEPQVLKSRLEIFIAAMESSFHGYKL